MRSIIAAIFGIALAAGTSYALDDHAQTPEQLAGTLTCVTKPELSLVFGRTQVADCGFRDRRDIATVHYDAMVAAPDCTGDTDVAQRIVFRAWRTGSGDGMATLGGTFRPDADGKTDGAARFGNGRAHLEVVSHSGCRASTFGRSHHRIRVAVSAAGHESFGL